eukprot:12024371-Alexandrium_andersonii.AAC.1
MSASLVGSEMCIRDRPRGAAAARCGCGVRLRRGACLSEAGGAPLAGAVSYTHLTLPTICSV